jgi:hypothetical protein
MEIINKYSIHKPSPFSKKSEDVNDTTIKTNTLLIPILEAEEQQKIEDGYEPKIIHNYKREITSFISMVLFTFILSTVLFTLPIIEIYMGIKHHKFMSCDLSVPLSVWFITKGCVELITGLIINFVLYSMYISNKKMCAISMLLHIPMLILTLFLFVFEIIGAILFLSQCEDIESTNVEILMWCSVIVGFIILMLNTIIINIQQNKLHSMY